jgi:L,D-peptidoglycan transpeptidase YkuD (ErfK/YbiS/YcfS/YnhG family)
VDNIQRGTKRGGGRVILVSMTAGRYGFALALVMALALASAPARAQVPAATRRALVVVTDGWQATTGTLRRFTRAGQGAPWLPVGDAVPVAVGKRGLGWGDGLVPRPPGSDGPQKLEGDGRAPAGLFGLGDVTGYDAVAPPDLTLAYRAATPSLRCVDDGNAAQYYNQIVDAPDGKAPWSSDEKMRRQDELYRFTVFVRHNDARVPGRGSCVFLHVWRRPGAPTVGCTAMALPSLRALLPFIDGHTVLIQLPRAAYARLQRDWDLPPLLPAPPPGMDQR